jgi:PAS domain S-box-containing protein
MKPAASCSWSLLKDANRSWIMPHSLQVPSEIVQKWQEIVDLLAEIMHIPSALIMEVEPPNIKVFVSSESKGNPYEPGETACLNTGLYCETVMKTRRPLLVPDALADEDWKSNPDIKLGMISYLGFPISWPDGEIFGTICVLDNKKNEYGELYRKLLLQCREMVQADLRSLATLSRELSAQKAHLDELFMRVPEAIVLVDAGQVVRANPEFTRIFGYAESEVLGWSLNDLIVPEELRAEAREITRGGNKSRSLSFETVRTHKDGTRVPVSVMRVPVTSEAEGSRTAEYAIYRDISDRKQAEEALRKAQGELAHVTRVTTLGEMAASIAHEVNQPLAGIVTNANACRRWLAGATPNLDEAREAVGRILRDGNRASDVIAHIRALVRKTDTQKERLDMNQAVQEVINLTQHEAMRKGLVLRTELAHDLPLVLGDRVQLQQVILNLVMNGVEAMASVADRPRELFIRSRQHESDKVLVAVQDSGVGIDRENLGKIFDAFYTTKPQGMGMGLAIGRSIVENHGGRLWAIPNDGPGVTFAFALPCETAGATRNQPGAG